MTEHMSLDQYRKETGTSQPKPASKYGNSKVSVDGILFDSKAEASRYGDLKLLQKSGEIKGFNRQPSFLFASGIRYRPDFIVFGLDEIWCEDVKGFATKEFLIKKRIWASEYPNLRLEVIK